MPKRAVETRLRPLLARDAVLHVRLSEIQLAAIEEAAEALNLRVSDFVRQVIASAVRRTNVDWPVAGGE